MAATADGNTPRNSSLYVDSTYVQDVHLLAGRRRRFTSAVVMLLHGGRFDANQCQLSCWADLGAHVLSCVVFYEGVYYYYYYLFIYTCMYIIFVVFPFVLSSFFFRQWTSTCPFIHPLNAQLSSFHVRIRSAVVVLLSSRCCSSGGAKNPNNG